MSIFQIAISQFQKFFSLRKLGSEAPQPHTNHASQTTSILVCRVELEKRAWERQAKRN